MYAVMILVFFIVMSAFELILMYIKILAFIIELVFHKEEMIPM